MGTGMGLRFDIEGREYEYDRELTVKDAMFIFEKSGVGIAALTHALLVEANPNVIAAWVYVMKRRAGEAVTWEDVLKIRIADYKLIPDPDPEADEVEGEEAKEQADPTSKPGKTRQRGTTNT